jgi:hypothetical protein
VQGQQRLATRSSTSQIMSLDSVPIKNILKENSALRNTYLKERIVKLRYSPVLQIGASTQSDPFKKLRRQTLLSLIDSKICAPGEKIDTGRSDQLLLSMQSIAKEVKASDEVRLIEVGSVRLQSGHQTYPVKLDRMLYGQMRVMLPDSIQA